MELQESSSGGGVPELPRGRYPGRLDDRSRLKLPAAFVHLINGLPEKKLFLTSLDRRTAQLYPIAEWRANEKFFDGYQADPEAVENILFNAQDLGADVEMDSQGRVTFHPDLRRELGMEGTDLHLISVKGHVEILTDALYQERKQKSTENATRDLRVLQKDGLR